MCFGPFRQEHQVLAQALRGPRPSVLTHLCSRQPLTKSWCGKLIALSKVLRRKLLKIETDGKLILSRAGYVPEHQSLGVKPFQSQALWDVVRQRPPFPSFGE